MDASSSCNPSQIPSEGTYIEVSEVHNLSSSQYIIWVTGSGCKGLV